MSRRESEQPGKPLKPARVSMRHGRTKNRGATRTIFAVVGAALAVLLVSTTSVAAVAVWDIATSIQPSVELIDEAIPPKLGAIEGPVNFLLVGSDSRANQSAGEAEGDTGSILNDVNIFVHVSADHKNATVVSIPRDMVIPYAECPDGGGGWTGPINGLLFEGGLACVVSSVSDLIGMPIPYAAQIGFDGVVELSNAVGGVEVCVSQDMQDSYTGMELPAGNHVLAGNDALLFLRSRHGVGDGSDLGRISSQQVFMSSLFRKLKAEGTLANPITLYSMAKAIASNMTLSSSLNNIDTLMAIAMALKDIPLESVTFVQYPGSTGGEGIYAGKVQPNFDAAAVLFEALANDQPIALTGDSGRGSVVSGTVTDPTPTATPTATATPGSTSTPTPTPTQVAAAPVELPSAISGSTAGQVTCTQGRTLDQQ